MTDSEATVKRARKAVAKLQVDPPAPEPETASCALCGGSGIMSRGGGWYSFCDCPAGQEKRS